MDRSQAGRAKWTGKWEGVSLSASDNGNGAEGAERVSPSRAACRARQVEPGLGGEPALGDQPDRVSQAR